MSKKIRDNLPLPSTLHLDNDQVSELQKVEEAVTLTHTAPTWKEYLHRMHGWLDLRHIA